ncbi:MAG: DNA replication/repair protein RecF [Candidatus Saccharibacteria bacterium]
MLTRLELENFRSYEKIGVDCGSDLVLVLGENAAGKTNLLEAVYYLNTLESFRSPDPLVVRRGAGHFRVSGRFDDGREAEVVVQTSPVTRRGYRIDKQKTRRSDWSINPVVLFVPQDLNLFFLGPANRREFVNRILSQVNPGYRTDLSELTQVLKQKTALLEAIRDGVADRAELSFWNDRLADISLRIYEGRSEFASFVNSRFPEVYARITDLPGSFSLEYRHMKKTEKSELMAHLTEHIEAEVASGTNLIGPHRDDYRLLKDGVEVIHLSSQGELRSQILALKLIEAAFLEGRSGRKATVLLDDVFSELDEMRRGRLMEFFAENQVFITTTEEHHLPGFKREFMVLRLSQSLLN